MANTVIRNYYNTKLAMRTNDDGGVEFFEKKWWNGLFVWCDLPVSAGIVRMVFHDLLLPTAMDFWMYDQEYDWEEKTSDPKLYLRNEIGVLENQISSLTDMLDKFNDWIDRAGNYRHRQTDIEAAEVWESELANLEYALFMLGG